MRREAGGFNFLKFIVSVVLLSCLGIKLVESNASHYIILESRICWIWLNLAVFIIMHCECQNSALLRVVFLIWISCCDVCRWLFHIARFKWLKCIFPSSSTWSMVFFFKVFITLCISISLVIKKGNKKATLWKQSKGQQSLFHLIHQGQSTISNQGSPNRKFRTRQYGRQN